MSDWPLPCICDLGQGPVWQGAEAYTGIPLNRQAGMIEYITFPQIRSWLVMTMNGVHHRNKIFQKPQSMRICFRSRYMEWAKQMEPNIQYTGGVKVVYQIFVNSLLINNVSDGIA